MPVQKLTYTNSKLKFIDVDDIHIEPDVVCNLFNWNSLYKINYKGDGEFDIKEKINDTPALIDGEEYLIYYEDK